MAIHPREREANRRTILSMLETTPATVARPYGPSSPDDETVPDLDFDWRPQPLDKTVEGRRTFRWPIIGAAAGLGLLALLSLQFLVTVPQERADERRVVYHDALDEFEVSLTSIREVATPSDPEALAAFSDALAVFAEVAEADLPSPIPLLPIGPIEDLRPARSSMLNIVDSGEDMITSLAAASTYRQAASRILALPLLPTSAPPELIDPAARAIADMQSNTIRAFEALDDDPAFTDYRTRVQAAIETLDDWADRYLLALRRGEVENTTALIAEMQARADLANAELEDAVIDLDEAAIATLSTMQRLIDEARVRLG